MESVARSKAMGFCLGAVILVVAILSLLLLPAACAENAGATRAPASRSYTDALGDVKDKDTGLQTSAKPMYDISNVSYSLGTDSVALSMVLASGIDRDGFYIFQCEVEGVLGYKFYFSKDAFGGLGPGGGPVPVSGNATGNVVKVQVARALLGTFSSFDIDNASAQDGTLRYIDVLDCAAQRSIGEAVNSVTLSIPEAQLLLLHQVTTYSDSRALKDGMDTDGNGYVDAVESQSSALSLEAGLNRYISNNSEAYYGSCVYVDGERPWDISLRVTIWVDEFLVQKADQTSITIDYFLEYRKAWESSITISLPPAYLAANIDQGRTAFTLLLPGGYSIDRAATDAALSQGVFQNGSGLSLDDAGFKSLTNTRYDVVVKTPLKDPEGTGAGIYVIIVVISITIAFCIFVGYQRWKKRGSDERRGKGTDERRGKGTDERRGKGTDERRGKGTDERRGKGTAGLRGKGTDERRGKGTNEEELKKGRGKKGRKGGRR